MLEFSQLDKLIYSALQEDIGEGDHSTLSCIPPEERGRAVLKIKQDGILAGMDVAKRIFELKELTSNFKSMMSDGQRIKSGEIAFEIESSIHTILQCERVVLNCMQRMSGIATLTSRYVEKIKDYHTKVLDTRKTTPNFRLLEKEAVRIGGGQNHRMGLYDMIMLKDNHIDYAGGIKKAIERAYKYLQKHNLELAIEVETRNLDEVKQVIESGKANRIMLDNFSLSDLRAAIDLIARRFETEASGGINLDNIEEYAKTGVDFISSGALIHQAQSLDMSLKAVVERKKVSDRR